MRTRRFLTFFAAAGILLAGCSTSDDIYPDISNEDDESGQTVITEDDGSGTFTLSSADTDTSEDNVSLTSFERKVSVVFSNSSAAKVSGAGDNLSVSVSGNGVTITNNGEEKVIYELSGTTGDGFLKLYGAKKQAIVLNGVSITNSSGAAINNQNKKRTFVVVNGNNSLVDGASYTSTPSEEDEKATFFSEGQLVFSGNGTLEVTARGKSGISSDDYVRFMSSPTVRVNSEAGHGVRGKDYIAVSAGTMDIDVSADGKKGFNSDSLVVVTGGIIDISVTGGVAVEDGAESGSAGIKADQLFTMEGGSLNVTVSGDGGKGVSSDGNGKISGGSMKVVVSGKSTDETAARGLKFDGTLDFAGGEIYVSASGDRAIVGKTAVNLSGAKVYAYSGASQAIFSSTALAVSDGVVAAIGTGGPGLSVKDGSVKISGGLVMGVGTKVPQYESSLWGVCGKAVSSTVMGIDGIASLELPAVEEESLFFIIGKDFEKGGTYDLLAGCELSGGTSLFDGLVTTGASAKGGASTSVRASQAFSSVTSVSVDCSDLNSDIAAMQALYKENKAGNEVLSVQGKTITFTSGNSVTVNVRDSYGFSYVNPVPGMSGDKWTLDGKNLGVGVSDELIQITGADNYWQVVYGGDSHKLDLIEDGVSIPVFKSLSYDEDYVTIGLAAGGSLICPIYKAPALSVSESQLGFEADGGSLTLKVTAENCTWTASVSDSWVTLDKSTGSDGTAEVKVTAAANGTYEGREASLTFKAGDLVSVVKVTQDGQLVPTLSLSEESVSFGAAGGAAKVKVTAENCTWTASAADSWVTLDKSTGSDGTTAVTVTVAANKTITARETTVTFKAGTLTSTVKVSQEAAEPGLSLGVSQLSFTSEGGSSELSITAENTSWSASTSATWVTLSESSGPAGTTSIKVTASANTSSQERTATVKFTAGTVSSTLTISQEGASSLTVSTSSLSFDAEGGSSAIVVTAENVSWTASSSATWAALSVSKGSSGSTDVTVTAAANSTSSSRTAVLTFTAGDLETYVTVTQAAAPSLALSATSASFDADGGFTTIVVTASNCTWTASAADSWVTLGKSSGSAGSTNVTVTAAANTSSARSTTVTFTAGSLTATLQVSQASGESSGGGTEDDGEDTGAGTYTITSSDSESSDDNVSLTTFSRKVTVVYSSSSASVSGAGSNLTVSVSGNDVTITNNGEENIIYELSGSTSDGFFKLYSSKKQAIVLNGVSITNKNGAAINNQSPKRTFVVVNGTNSLADGSSYSDTPSDEDEKAALFSEGQLVFSGSGSLSVTANGKAGITSDDYVRFMSSPTVSVTSSAGHGIRGKEAVTVSSGTITSTVSASMKKGITSDGAVQIDGGYTTVKVTGSAGYDSEDGEYTGTAGIKSDGTFAMNAGTLSITNSGSGGKGISTDGAATFTGGTVTISSTGNNYTSGDISSKGMKIDGALSISGGSLSVTCSKSEAIECKSTITISGGQIYSYSTADDAINAASDFTITGGYVCGISTANDGLDSNGNFYIKGGVVMASGKGSPDLAIDANTEGGKKLYVTGGTLFAISGLESGASLSQSCYQSSSWSKGTWYGMTVGSTTYAFKTPSSGGSPLVVSGSSKPTLVSAPTINGGTSCCGGMMKISPTLSGGSSVSLSSYTSSGGGRW